MGAHVTHMHGFSFYNHKQQNREMNPLNRQGYCESAVFTLSIQTDRHRQTVQTKIRMWCLIRVYTATLPVVSFLYILSYISIK